MYKGEIFNSVSHLVGAVLALIGASVLITLAAVEGNVLKIVSYSVYSTTLFLLYLASTLYHSFQGRAKAIFQRFDHLAIYLLIAGTYTPFTLLAIKGSTGWWLFGVVWTLAVIGMIIENLPIKGPRVIPIVIYLVMGWCSMFSTIGFLGATKFGICSLSRVVFVIISLFFYFNHLQ